MSAPSHFAHGKGGCAADDPAGAVDAQMACDETGGPGETGGDGGIRTLDTALDRITV